MGVASPLQSGKPVDYWLGGLTTSELVHLWEFLSRNLDDEEDQSFLRTLPTGKQVEKHLYSESLPSSIYACKDRGGPPSTAEDQHRSSKILGLYKHRRARDPLNK